MQMVKIELCDRNITFGIIQDVSEFVDQHRFCESRIKSVFNQRKFCGISSHLETGPLVGNWKMWAFLAKKSFKNESPVTLLHLKYVVCFYINPLME